MLPSAVLASCKHRSHTHKWLLQARRSETATQQHTTLHPFFEKCCFFVVFFFSLPAASSLPHPTPHPHRFGETSGTKYELTNGNGMTGVERRASKGASEGGFIYSGKRGRGRALQRRRQPSVPSADRKHVCANTFGRADRRLRSLFAIIQFPGKRRHFDAHAMGASCDCVGRK